MKKLIVASGFTLLLSLLLLLPTLVKAASDQVLRYADMNLKIQVPSEYKANKEKNHFTAKRSDGVSFSVQFTPMGPDACLSRFKKDKGEAQKAFQNGGLVRVQEKKVGSYEKSTPVVYTLSKKGTAHTVKWQGCDYPRKRYVTIAAQFPGNTYSLHQPEADRMFASIRWQHDAR